MTAHARQAALRIQLLMEEFSSDDLAQAISLLGGRQGEDLLAFLNRTASEHSPKRQIEQQKSISLTTSGESRVLQEIQETDPDKYQILSEFDKLAREGRLLKTLDEFRTFGKVISKGFLPGKSRKEALGRLPVVLAQMDLKSLQNALARIPHADGGDESAFQRLANHIITGVQSRSRSE